MVNDQDSILSELAEKRTVKKETIRSRKRNKNKRNEL